MKGKKFPKIQHKENRANAARSNILHTTSECKQSHLLRTVPSDDVFKISLIVHSKSTRESERLFFLPVKDWPIRLAPALYLKRIKQ